MKKIIAIISLLFALNASAIEISYPMFKTCYLDHSAIPHQVTRNFVQAVKDSILAGRIIVFNKAPPTIETAPNKYMGFFISSPIIPSVGENQNCNVDYVSNRLECNIQNSRSMFWLNPPQTRLMFFEEFVQKNLAMGTTQEQLDDFLTLIVMAMDDANNGYVTIDGFGKLRNTEAGTMVGYSGVAYQDFNSFMATSATVAPYTGDCASFVGKGTSNPEVLGKGDFIAGFKIENITGSPPTQIGTNAVLEITPLPDNDYSIRYQFPNDFFGEPRTINADDTFKITLTSQNGEQIELTIADKNLLPVPTTDVVLPVLKPFRIGTTGTVNQNKLPNVVVEKTAGYKYTCSVTGGGPCTPSGGQLSGSASTLTGTVITLEKLVTARTGFILAFRFTNYGTYSIREISFFNESNQRIVPSRVDDQWPFCNSGLWSAMFDSNTTTGCPVTTSATKGYSFFIRGELSVINNQIIKRIEIVFGSTTNMGKLTFSSTAQQSADAISVNTFISDDPMAQPYYGLCGIVSNTYACTNDSHFCLPCSCSPCSCSSSNCSVNRVPDPDTILGIYAPQTTVSVPWRDGFYETESSYNGLGEGDYKASCNFVEKEYFSLALSKTGTGNGSVSNTPTGSSFTSGTSLSLTATPDANSVFAGWSGPGCTASFAITSDMNCVATFNEKPPVVTVCPAEPAGYNCPKQWREILGATLSQFGVTVIDDTGYLTVTFDDGTVITGYVSRMGSIADPTRRYSGVSSVLAGFITNLTTQCAKQGNPQWCLDQIASNQATYEALQIPFTPDQYDILEADFNATLAEVAAMADMDGNGLVDYIVDWVPNIGDTFDQMLYMTSVQ